MLRQHFRSMILLKKYDRNDIDRFLNDKRVVWTGRPRIFYGALFTSFFMSVGATIIIFAHTSNLNSVISSFIFGIVFVFLLGWVSFLFVIYPLFRWQYNYCYIIDSDYIYLVNHRNCSIDTIKIDSINSIKREKIVPLFFFSNYIFESSNDICEYKNITIKNTTSIWWMLSAIGGAIGHSNPKKSLFMIFGREVEEIIAKKGV